jgi:hypothetical protein
MLYSPNKHSIRAEWKDIGVLTLTDIIAKEYGTQRVDYILGLDIRTNEGMDALMVVYNALKKMNHPSVS